MYIRDFSCCFYIECFAVLSREFIINVMVKGNGENGNVSKSSMAKSLPVENLLPQNVGSIINYSQ